jgi:hypothetical protein
MITYSTNWMGPISIDWFRDRGLTKVVTLTVESEMQRDILRRSRPDIEVGDTFEREEITTYYGAGRIDIRDDTKHGYDGWNEYSLPPMHGEDWNSFSEWLDDFTTERLFSFDELIAQYEQESGTVIRWWKEEKNTC